MNDPWQIPGSGVPRLAADPRRADPLAGGSSSPALDGAARAPPPPDHDLAALHVAAADIPALYHGLRAHPNFRRLLLHLDGSAHVVVSTDAAHWGSLRQLVPAAVPDPAFPLKHLAAAAAQGPNAGVAPSPVLAVRYQPYNFSRADVERLLSLFPGVVNVEVRRMIQPTPGQMPVGEAFIALSNEDFARHLLETLNQTTNWEAVYIRMSPSVTGFVDGLVSQKVSSPAASAQNPALGSSDSFSSAKNGRIPSDPFANGALGPSGPAAQAFVNPGTSTGTRLPQQLPTTPARNELTEIQVIISHPPGTAKDQAGNWVVRTVPGLENIIWVPPPGEPDGQSTAALLRFLSPQLLQNFLSQQPIQDGIFGIVVSSVPVPIISVPASTPTPSFNAIGGAPNLTQQQALPGLGRESWGIASRDGSSMRRDRSTGSGSEDRDFSRDRLAGRPQNSFNAPRNTLQLTSIPPHLDRADLRRFSRSLTGFKKIAFYRDWCFLVFVSSEAAHAAMRIVNDGTVGFLGGMRASFTKENYLQKHPPPPSGPPNPTLYVTNLPFNANPNEFRRLFSDFEGFQDAYFFRGSCKVYFRDTECADRTRKELNEETNLVATFWSGGGGGANAGAASSGSNYANSSAGAASASSRGGSEAGFTRSAGSEKSSDRGSENAPSESGDDGDEDDETYSAKMASSIGSLASSHAASSRAPRATIHITNLSVGNASGAQVAGSHDKADLLQLLSSYAGFVRVAFYRDWVFAVFSSPQFASEAIDRLHRETKMRASYAREEYAPNYIVPEAGTPCPVLYVCNLPWDATNLELTKIFKMYDGFREVYFFREACKVYFDETSRAKKCLDDLNLRTNLIATFFKGEGVTGLGEDEQWEDDAKAMLAGQLGALGIGTAGYSALSKAEPKSTLHISNLTKDRAELKQFFGAFEGFVRIAFYPNWIFVVFKDVATASKAIEVIHASTRMQAAFAMVDYAAPFVRPEVGDPTKVVRVGNFPSNAVEGEFVKLFRSYQGTTGEVRFGREDCLVSFHSVEAAKAFLDDINGKTNLCAVFHPTGFLVPGATGGRTSLPNTAASSLPGSVGSGISGFGGREERLEFWEDDDPVAMSSSGTSSVDADYMGMGQSMLQNSASHTPKVTLKIGNITMDRADVRRTLASLDGFQRIAFYRDYIYACFATVDHARRAMEWLHINTRMRCVFPKYDYTSRNDRTDPGVPGPILHVGNLPFNATPGEFVKIFAAYEGYRDVQFFRESCLVFFASAEDAARAARDLNESTNLVAAFTKKGLAPIQGQQQQAQIQASIAASSLLQDKLRLGGQNDVRNLATVGLGYLFANDARFEGVTASTLGLNDSGTSRLDDLQRRHSNPVPLAPNGLGGHRLSAPFIFSGTSAGDNLFGRGSLFSPGAGDRKPFEDPHDDDWLDQHQRRRSLALAEEIVGFDDNTEDARYGFNQHAGPWDTSTTNASDAFGRKAMQTSRPSLLNRSDRSADAANTLFNASSQEASAGTVLPGLDLATSPLGALLHNLPQPAKQYIAALKAHIATLESKLNETTAELEHFKKAPKPMW